jgi:hypothetical protein
MQQHRCSVYRLSHVRNLPPNPKDSDIALDAEHQCSWLRDCCRVTKVRQFQKLALMSSGDGQMQQRLKQLLKLSKEKWDSACDHAKTAVNVRHWCCRSVMPVECA